MPKSKHRRKAGGKSVQRPGRRALSHWGDPFWVFHHQHVEPFHREFFEKEDAGFIMDLLGNSWTPETQAVRGKARLVAEFIEGAEDPMDAAAKGEAAIEWLCDHGWIAVDGEDVRIIPRESAATRM